MIEVILRSLALLQARKRVVGALVIANILFAILVLMEPVFFKLVIDTMVQSQVGEIAEGIDIQATLFYWLVVWVVIIVLRLFVSVMADRLAHEEFNNCITRFFSHTMQLSMAFHTSTSSGKMSKELIRGSDNLFYTHLEFFRKVMPEIFTIILLVPLIIYLNWKMGIFVVILGFSTTLLAIFSVKKTFTQQEAVERYYTQLSALYNDTFGNIGIVKSFTLTGIKHRELQGLLKKRLEKQYPILYWWGFLISFSKVINIIISLGVIFFWSYLFSRWEITIGDIVMFLSFATLFLWAVESLMWSIEWLFWRIAPMKEFFAILDQNISVTDIPWAKKLESVKGHIEFKNVDFGYDKKRKILKWVSFQVFPGEKIAFVWHTGSGKTTTSSLLLRFFDPQSGVILIDGIDIKTVTQTSLRKAIWVVFQDNSLFNTTIRENIKLDSKTATDQDILKVAEKSHAIEFIRHFPDGLDTIVGERWVKLSWGEKQRLALARAFLKNAPILVLDEATSALDAQTEKYLQASLEELMSKRTTFIIAHRLSTIRKADRIFVFDNGKIVEEGTYKSLSEKGGYFTKLVQAQIDGFIND